MQIILAMTRILYYVRMGGKCDEEGDLSGSSLMTSFVVQNLANIYVYINMYI